MSDKPNIHPNPPPSASQQPLLQRAWQSLRISIQSKPWFGNFLARLIYSWLLLVHKTNRVMVGSASADEVFSEHAPAIFAIWHGQHLMVPFFSPKWAKVVTLFSKSADAEINAKLAQLMGFETVRGSGGREPSKSHKKGGAKALIGLKKALDVGKYVVMIADISKSTPRQSGMGIITLAKISGRPIIAVAYASSRRHVLANTWDKTTLNLPFGQSTIITSQPIFVARDADDQALEACRLELDAKLTAVTEQAYTMVDTSK